MAGTLDRDLIREYARNGAEGSFGELVHRHVEHHTNTRLLAEIEELRQQGAELARLREELRRLIATRCSRIGSSKRR